VSANHIDKVSVRRKGVTRELRSFFWKYPHSSAKECCTNLGLDYNTYKKMCWRIKSETKKRLEGKVQGRVLNSHRLEFRTDKPLERGVVGVVEFEALRRTPLKGDSKPFDEWYVIPNRNRQLQFVNSFVSIRVFPKSGTCRVLPRQRMDFESLKVHVQNAFFKAGLDLRVCEVLSTKLEPHTQDKVFKVGPVTPFQIDYYRKPLGITIKADGSHPEHIEVSEDWPSWIKPLLSAFALQTDVTADLSKNIKAHLSVMRGIDLSTQNLSKSTQSLERTITKLGGAIKDLSVARGSPYKSKPTTTRKRRRKPGVRNANPPSTADKEIENLRKRVQDTLDHLRSMEIE